MKNPQKDFVVGLATHAHSSVDFDVHYNHMSVLQEWVQEYGIKLLGYKGLLAAQARELICETAIDEGCDSLLILDADHLIPVDTLPFLLENKDEAIVSGLICRRFHPFEQVAYGKIDVRGTYVPIEIPLDGKIYEVGVCAFGCTLINMSKLQKLEKPWFRDSCDKDHEGHHRNIRSDINLCNAFRENGEKAWIDTRVLVGHVGNNVVVHPQNARFMRCIKPLYDDSFGLRINQQGMYNMFERTL